MAKAYSLTWFVFLGALPMVIMIVLYSRVVYCLWIKEERSTAATHKVTTNITVPHFRTKPGLISVLKREGSGYYSKEMSVSNLAGL